MKVARVKLSDRASAGVYSDASGPEIERIVEQSFDESLQWVRIVQADDRAELERTLCRLVDQEQCSLVLTAGGTGPSARDFTPEATRSVLEKELPGFGEIMRLTSFAHVKTAVLSRATAGIRGRSLIINLPGRPSAVAECLPLLLPSIAEALDHIAGFRPKLRA